MEAANIVKSYFELGGHSVEQGFVMLHLELFDSREFLRRGDFKPSPGQPLVVKKG